MSPIHARNRSGRDNPLYLLEVQVFIDYKGLEATSQFVPSLEFEMKTIVTTLVTVLVFSSVVRAADIKWVKKPDGSGFVNENRLPPGARVTARVVTLDDNKTQQPFEINGTKHIAKNVGDVFTETVDNNGFVYIKHILPNVSVGNDLSFGIMNENSKTKAVRWSLILRGYPVIFPRLENKLRHIRVRRVAGL